MTTSCNPNPPVTEPVCDAPVINPNDTGFDRLNPTGLISTLSGVLSGVSYTLRRWDVNANPGDLHTLTVVGTNGNDTVNIPALVALGGFFDLNTTGRPTLIDGIPVAVTFDGRDGNDVFVGGTYNDEAFGGRGDDNLSGDDGDDFLDGGRGNDTLNGGNGNDEILGGLGNDAIDGGAGNDEIDGGEGNDQIAGGTGNDVIAGGLGNDVIDGGAGNDELAGGLGNDTITGGDGDDDICGGDGNDSLSGGNGDDEIAGGAGGDTINGDAGNDNLFGGADDDVLNGGTGNDFMLGGAGDDVLNGGAGNDNIAGGAGDDTMNGNAGRDNFLFYSAEGPTGTDLINAFSLAQIDQIDLRGLCNLDFIDMLRLGANTARLDLYYDSNSDDIFTADDLLIGTIVVNGSQVGNVFQNDTAYRSSGDAAPVLANAGVIVDLPTNDDYEIPGLLIV